MCPCFVDLDLDNNVSGTAAWLSIPETRVACHSALPVEFKQPFAVGPRQDSDRLASLTGVMNHPDLCH